MHTAMFPLIAKTQQDDSLITSDQEHFTKQNKNDNQSQKFEFHIRFMITYRREHPLARIGK